MGPALCRMRKLKAPGPDQPHGQRRRSFDHSWAEWKLNVAPLRTTFHGYDSRRVITRLSVHPGPPGRLECVAGRLGVKAVPQLRWPFVPRFLTPRAQEARALSTRAEAASFSLVLGVSRSQNCPQGMGKAGGGRFWTRTLNKVGLSPELKWPHRYRSHRMRTECHQLSAI